VEEVAAVPALLADASLPGCGWMPEARTVQPDGVCLEQGDGQSSDSKTNQSISPALSSTCEFFHAQCSLAPSNATFTVRPR
jgi:hypothetical protein